MLSRYLLDLEHYTNIFIIIINQIALIFLRSKKIFYLFVFLSINQKTILKSEMLLLRLCHLILISLEKPKLLFSA